MKYCPAILAPGITQQFEQFAWMEQPWTHEILSYDPSSLNYSIVQAVQKGEKYIELMKYSFMILDPSITR